ncbi:MAG: hypothetical protein ACHQ1D_06915 [Nitrososphaerales archaeon]
MEILLGGLVSILTLAVTKLFDYYFASKAHLQSLQKEYFLKKINAFEKTASYYTIAHTSITNMAIVLETGIKENVKYSKDDGELMMREIQKNLQTVISSTIETASSIGLYTDLDLSDDDERLAESAFEIIGELNLISAEINDIYESMDKENYASAKATVDKIDIEFNKMKEKVEELKVLSKVMKGKYKSFTNILRLKLAKYDV